MIEKTFNYISECIKLWMYPSLAKKKFSGDICRLCFEKKIKRFQGSSKEVSRNLMKEVKFVDSLLEYIHSYESMIK